MYRSLPIALLAARIVVRFFEKKNLKTPISQLRIEEKPNVGELDWTVQPYCRAEQSHHVMMGEQSSGPKRLNVHGVK